MHLPFPQGQSLFVIQGFDDPTGSHRGIAAFCWDLMLAGQPQSASNRIPFFAAASGTVDFVKQDNFSGGAGPANVISIKEADHEFCDYLHLRQNSAAVTKGAQVAFGTALADVGDTGAAQGAFHLHMAVTNPSWITKRPTTKGPPGDTSRKGYRRWGNGSAGRS